MKIFKSIQKQGPLGLGGVVFAVGLVLLLSVPKPTSAVCCYSYYPKVCADCSEASYMGYCAAGNGGCNIFGCNCDGGCKQPPVGKKGCAPTAHLFSPRLVSKPDKHCHVIDEDAICNGRELYT